MIGKIGLVSLSSGIIGEEYVRHEVELGLKRIKQFGVDVRIMPNAQKGMDYLKEHPEKRADDLIEAFTDDSIDMILCAIGGEDTYRLLPYLLEEDRLMRAVSQKVFLGFSDSTINHLMLYKLGIKTFYGQSFLADICELEPNMLEYTQHYFEELIRTGAISEIRPSERWFEERTDYSEAALGTPRKKHTDRGFELLQGPSRFSGAILGGCLESLFYFFDNKRYADSVEVCNRYHIFPSLEEWKGKILLLETSEEKPTPEEFEKMLLPLKEYGIFDVISGMIVGKPMDESYYEEYKRLLVDVVGDRTLPILYNVNVGHSTPRCIVPLGVHAEVDAEEQVIKF